MIESLLNIYFKFISNPTGLFDLIHPLLPKLLYQRLYPNLPLNSEIVFGVQTQQTERNEAFSLSPVPQAKTEHRYEAEISQILTARSAHTATTIQIQQYSDLDAFKRTVINEV